MCKVLSPKRAFWVVPRGHRARHAITTAPSAFRSNSAVKAVCGKAVSLPLPTPNDRVPKSRSVTARCAGCAAVIAHSDVREVVWDS